MPLEEEEKNFIAAIHAMNHFASVLLAEENRNSNLSSSPLHESISTGSPTAISSTHNLIPSNNSNTSNADYHHNLMTINEAHVINIRNILQTCQNNTTSTSSLIEGQRSQIQTPVSNPNYRLSSFHHQTQTAVSITANPNSSDINNNYHEQVVEFLTLAVEAASLMAKKIEDCREANIVRLSAY